MLKIYNTMIGAKAPFVPLQKNTINLYVCGMTVYDYCHIGHARVMISFDFITRYLRGRGFQVNYVRNITDIDDKIINRALENQETIGDLTERFIAYMKEDEAALGLRSPDREPRATAHMDDILAMITQLIENGAAYVADNGDVYFAVKSFANYAKLSKRNLEDLRVGARVEVGEDKRDPLDFALWKSAKPDEPHWSSPWGPGRPGWHIECSAMSTKCLGETFDIHGGGFDLIFPHHENEIAQAEAATGKSFVNTWMHVGFLQINKEKMSKSLGNFFTIRDVLKRYPAEVIRYFMVCSHYRSPLNYSDEALDNAHAALTRFYTALRGLEVAEKESSICQEYETRFYEAMDDDFNTPEALAVLFDMTRELNRLRQESAADTSGFAVGLRRLAGMLGLLNQDPEAFLRGGSTEDDAEIDKMITARDAARANKDWAESDRLRDELQAKGIIIEDSAAGTRWRRS